jgi:hypothetical protein
MAGEKTRAPRPSTWCGARPRPPRTGSCRPPWPHPAPRRRWPWWSGSRSGSRPERQYSAPEVCSRSVPVSRLSSLVCRLSSSRSRSRSDSRIEREREHEREDGDDRRGRRRRRSTSPRSCATRSPHARARRRRVRRGLRHPVDGGLLPGQHGERDAPLPRGLRRPTSPRAATRAASRGTARRTSSSSSTRAKPGIATTA